MRNVENEKTYFPQRDIEIRSEEVQEIISEIPSWIIQWGITLIFIMILIFIISSWFIQYPDSISARALVTTEVPPANIVARATGRLILLVEDQQIVKGQDVLGVIKNPAEMEDVFYLDRLVGEYKNDINRTDSINSVFYSQYLDKQLNLGELQNAFLAFQQSIRNYKLFQDLKAYDQQVASLQTRVNSYNKLNQQLEKQNEILKEELILSRKRFQTDSLLYSQKVISDLDISKAKSTFLQAESTYESAKLNIINNTIQIRQLQAQITDLSIEYSRQEVILKGSIRDNLDQLENQIENWKQQYLLQAPIGGKVSFSTYWSDNQFLNTGDAVMTVIPDIQKIFGQIYMPVIGSGKVKPGQKVNLKFDSYPANEYGMVTGRVESISLIPREGVYIVRISLPKGLITSYGKQLDFKQEMQGSAEIITENLRLIERVFNQLRALVDSAS